MIAIIIHPYISTPSLIVFLFFIESQFKVENVIVSKVELNISNVQSYKLIMVFFQWFHNIRIFNAPPQ